MKSSLLEVVKSIPFLDDLTIDNDHNCCLMRSNLYPVPASFGDYALHLTNGFFHFFEKHSRYFMDTQIITRINWLFGGFCLADRMAISLKLG